MSHRFTPVKGLRVELLQRYSQCDHTTDFKRVEHENVVPAEVFWVKRNGEYQVITDQGVKYMVRKDNMLWAYGLAGTIRVRLPS